jgi:N-acyl-D-aspartate/D-glutamate deacylase
MIPHSMLRIEVMGLQASVSRDPTPAELERMVQLLDQGMSEGYVGFSTDALPFHYLANRPNTRKQIPTQFAPFRELRRLTDVVRRWGRVWQATPPKDSRLGTLRTFLLSSGRLFGRPLKTTATAAIDLYTNRSIANMGLTLSRLINSRLIRGDLRFQALSAPFKIWSDGVITPIAEEIPELRVLNECELDDRDARRRILDDPQYVRAFKRMWSAGKRGLSPARLKRRLRLEDCVLTRRLDDMTVASCPLSHWAGETLEQPYRRLLAWQASGGQGAKNAGEAAFFGQAPNPIGDDADFLLHLLRQWDTALRWTTTTANRDAARLKKLVFDAQTLPGFNDSGAHLTNMAFYDGNLRTLKLAQEEGAAEVARSVQRLTRLPADFFGINAGTLVPGAQADVVVIDPEALRRWQPEATVEYIWRDVFESHQMVNRPQGVVTQTMIRGRLAWSEGAYLPAFGHEPYGRLLRARDHAAERSWIPEHRGEAAAPAAAGHRAAA